VKKVILFLSFLFAATPLFAQRTPDPVTSTGAGSFTLFGYNPRGAAIGSAMVAVTEGEYQYGAYNPALVAYQDGYKIAMSHTSLPFDRSLEFISFGGPIPTKHRTGTAAETDTSTVRGVRLQIGWLHAANSNIDARDYEGDQIGKFSETSNEFMGAAGVRLNQKLALGFAARFYYISLPTGNPSTPALTSGGFGLDLGVVYSPIDNLNVAGTIQHIATRFHWDSSTLYGEKGSSTTDYFPIAFKIGASYKLFDNRLLLASELGSYVAQYDSQDDISIKSSTTELNLGAEYELTKGLSLRAGMKGIDLSNALAAEQTLNFGIAYAFNIQGFQPTLSYAYVSENQAGSASQMISLGVRF